MRDARGGDLFVVDNSDSGWTGLRYLSEWAELSTSFDIATGFFEAGALLDLDGKWQSLDKIRILMGSDVTAATKKVLLDAATKRAQIALDVGLEGEKEDNPFLAGVPAIVKALRDGRIECRVFNEAKFHAKAYITHPRLDVVGAKALVGSSNFTRPGLTQNVELNIQIQSPGDVAQLQEWFNAHWDRGVDVSDDVLKVIERHTQEYTPFEVYMRAMQEFFYGHELSASEWEETESSMFKYLDRYQKEGYWNLEKIARQHGGAFLSDGVGLGKTFVGLMLIERLIVRDNKRVVLFAPKAAKEAVWEPHLRKYLGHIGGISDTVDFSSLAVFAHTDLSRKGFRERFRRIADVADAVIIDEAHHFRNRGPKPTNDDSPNSRYYELYDLLDPEIRRKAVYMLTATPINNRLTDLRHMIELFSRRRDNYFAQTLGVNSLTGHFNQMEKAVRQLVGLDKMDLSESLSEAHEVLAKDEIFKTLVVQRSRAYAVDSQKLEKGAAAVFPDRRPPKVAEYSIRKTYGQLLDRIEKAFKKDDPLFSLAIYYPEAYRKGEQDSIEANRQRQVVGLIRTLFLKRFESSVHAFQVSCDRLMRKFLAFLEVNSETEADKKRLDRWKRQNQDILNYARQTSLFSPEGESDETEDDLVPPELLAHATTLSPNEYKVDEILDETYLDLDEIVRFLEETKKFEASHDDKLNKLKRLIASREMKNQKILIFTEFADTARYLLSELEATGETGVAELDSSSKVDRAQVIRRFSPYYNGSSSAKLKKAGEDEIRVLIATDVLSEGLNLQDATRLINYDIHWNPVRIMQRIGRVDRRMNPETEQELVSAHPELAESRGKVLYWNFLPPDELNDILSLYKTVTGKALLISKTLGIEGKQFLKPDDDFEALKQFNQAYEGAHSIVEEMHLKYQELLQEVPGIGARIATFPGSMFSGRKKPAKGTTGVFFCYRLPALDTETDEFSEAAGTTRWYYYDLERNEVAEELDQILANIMCKPTTPRHCSMEEKSLVDIRGEIQKHITNTYLKRLNAPIGVKPSLKCWMEVNGS